MTHATTNQPDGGQLIATIRKNARKEIRVYANFKRRQHLDLRIWTDRDGCGDWCSTKHGISFKLDQIPELRAALKIVLNRMEPEPRLEIGL